MCARSESTKEGVLPGVTDTLANAFRPVLFSCAAVFAEETGCSSSSRIEAEKVRERSIHRGAVTDAGSVDSRMQGGII